MLTYLKNIYLADDDNDDVFLFEFALSKSGLQFDITISSNGQELLDKLQNVVKAPDIIFIDINMPKVDGLEALEKIKMQALFNSAPIVIYSTCIKNSSALKAMEAGASLYLIKPSDIEVLTKMLMKVLSVDWSNYIIPDRLDKFVLKS